MKSGAIFDMDGLLFDTEVLYNNGWEKVAKANGLFLNPKMLDEMRGAGEPIAYEIVPRYWPDADIHTMVRQVFEYVRDTLSENVPVKRGVRELLEYLKENGVKMAVASSSQRKMIMNNIKAARIDSYFDVVVSGDQVTHGKPAPDIFLLAADELGLRAKDCYVFEDGPIGVGAGVKAGCPTIMIPDLIKPTEELYKICIGIYPSLEDALEAIKKGDC